MNNYQELLWSETSDALDLLLIRAISDSATDIHIEPRRNDYRLRLRVDGNLVTVLENLPQSKALQLVSRIKVLSRLDIAETRSCQDGSFRFENSDRNSLQDIRVATAATRYGERITLRILGVNTSALTMHKLGFEASMLQEIYDVITRQSGLLLVTGPTGSGKSTTLYAALRERNNDHTNIMTIEDPVEYSIDGVTQIQVDQAGKVTFPTALRSILRHDPDVIMVGEIRDSLTAEIALRSAMTGHMVFSTLHTTSAANTITRLIDMGCEPYLVAATVSGCLAQRLVKRLCPHCRKSREATQKEKAFAGVDEIFFSEGCKLCSNKKYSGRIAVFEFLKIDSDVRELIRTGAGSAEIAAKANVYKSMKQDAVEKISAGLVDINEVMNLIAE